MPYQSNSAASDGDLARFDLRHPGHAVVRPPAARRLSAWHCYSAAGGPADAKAITRLVPRRDNRRDRDVA
jgi:hypothetical protein